MGRLSDDLIVKQSHGRVAEILEELDKDDRATFLKWLNDASYTPHAIAKALGRAGIKVHRSSIDNWRTEHAAS